MNRTVTIPLTTGGTVTVAEPAWCVADHARPVGHRQDLMHESATTAATAAGPSGPVEVLPAGVDQWPYARTDRLPRAVVELPGGWAPFTPQGLREFTAALVVHAGRLRDLAARVEQLRAEAGEGR